MPTKKALRRTVARELKHTGLPLPIRGRLAKLIVRGDDYRIGECLRDMGCTVVRTYGCDCCDPYAHQEWEYRGKTFFTSHGLLERKKNPPKIGTPKPKPTPPPIDTAALDKLAAMRKEHASLRARVSTVEYDMQVLATKLVRSHLGTKCPEWLEHGDWDCPTSPTKMCAYDHAEDGCHDSCLFCGDPEERK